MAEIKMYTTSWCGDCRMTKMFLAEKGISYEEIDIEKTPGAAEIVMQANDGKRKVPTLDIDGSSSPSARSIDASLKRRWVLHDPKAWSVMA